MSMALGILLCIVLLQGGSPSFHLAGKVELRLHVAKTQFVSGEVVTVDCSARNLVDKNVEIPLLNTSCTKHLLHVVDANNKRLRCRVVVYWDGPEQTETLPPKGRIVREFLLAEFAGNTEEPSFTGYIPNLKPGSYRVWVTLADVQSDTLQIQISAPTPLDRLVAERLNRVVSNAGKGGDYRQAIQSCEALIRSYPSSPYIHQFYDQLMLYLRWFDDSPDRSRRLRDVAAEYLYKFGDVGLASHGVLYYADAIMDSMGVRSKRYLSEAELAQIKSELMKFRATLPGERGERVEWTILNWVAGQKRSKQ